MRLPLALMLMMVLAASAEAQERPVFDLSGGYSVLRDTQADETFHGWLASAGGYVTPWLGIVGEVGRNAKSITPEPGFDLSFDVTTFMGGVRLTGAASPAVSAFAQIVAGGARFGTRFEDESDSETKFALQPGAGVDVFFGRNVGIRVGGDYRRVFVREVGVDGVNEFRFHAGLVVRVGG